MKNIKKWLLALVGILVLVVAVTAVFLLRDEPKQTQEKPVESSLYWNVEREYYKTGNYFHQKMEDGIYRMLFAVDGKQEKLMIKGEDLVKEIDTLDVMGFVFDENGYVVDVLHVDECAGGYFTNKGYVSKVEGNTVTVNNNYAFRGYVSTFELNDGVSVYDVSDTGPLCGMPSMLQENDEIIAVQDRDGKVTHVFTKPYKAPGDIYWNVEKQYDSVNKISSRQPNQAMVYEIDFVVNGERKTLLCRDRAVVDKIDAARIMGLEFDENGYIIGFKTAKSAANGGKSAAVNYYVSDLNYRDGQILMRKNAVYSELDSTVSYYPADAVAVYDMTGNEGTLGQVTQLQVNDRVICITDRLGKITTIFVGTRTEGQKLYWNVDRQWNKTTLSTNRRPDANGWYYFKMAVDGKHVTVKTDSLAIANALEKPICSNLQLDGDVVTKVQSYSKTYAGGVFASYLYIKQIQKDGTIVAERTVDGVLKTQSAKMAEDCKIFNVSATSVVEGEKMSASELKVGDTIHGFLDYNGQIAHLYVVGSLSSSPMYWNVDKEQYWDAANKTSTRTPDADGYYYITFATKGEQVTLRTSSKKMVDDIDNRTCMGLKLSGKTIIKVYGAVQTVKTGGGLFASNYYVTAINGNKITAMKLTGSDAGTTESRYLASGCEIYNVCDTAELVGQKSTVKVGDQIRCLLNKSKQITVLYVLTSGNHAQAHKCDCCNETPVWMAWDGHSTITRSGHYVLNGDTVASNGITWKPDMQVTLCLNGHSLTALNRRIFSNTTGTLNIVDCVGSGHVHGTANNNASITMVEGGKVNIYGGSFTAEEVTDVKNGGLFTIIGGGELNLFGGTISGGKTNGYGGNINVSDGTLTVSGGVIENGTSASGQYGGNVALSGANAVMIVKGGIIRGGNSGSYGGNIAVAKTGATLEILGGTIENGTAATHGGNLSVAMGAATIRNATFTGGTAGTFGSSVSLVNDAAVEIRDCAFTGGQLYARNSGGLTLGGKLDISELYLLGIQILNSETSPMTDCTIGIAMEFPGVFMENASAGMESFFTSVDDTYAPVNNAGILSLQSILNHGHCVCVGAEYVPADHKCTDKQEWTAITASTTIGEDGYYYLDFTSKAAAITVADGVHARLCLNGARIYAMKTITLGEGSTLDICDCSKDQTGIIGLSGGAERGPVVMDKASTLNLYSGTITGNMNSNTKQAVVINHADARFNMYGGMICNGVSASYGGNVAVMKGVFTMYAGLIRDGQASTHGGNITASGGRFVMLGGQVKDGIATTYGGNISFVTANSSGQLLGGSITGGTASSYASCVYVNNNNVVLGGSVVIDEVMFGGGRTATVSTEHPLTDSASIGLALQTAPTNYSTVLKGVEDLKGFCCTMEGFKLDTNAGNIVIKPQ